MLHKNSCDEVEIKLKENQFLSIIIESGIEANTLLKLSSDDAERNGEEIIQLLEGSSYEYGLPEGFSLSDTSGNIVKPSRKDKNRGRITPGIYVGRLPLTIESKENKSFNIAVEVRSIKADYRSEYRKMLEDITEECTDLLMIHSSPVTQRYTVNYEGKSTTLYQRFAFVKSIVDSDEFRNAVHRIITMPVTSWTHKTENIDIRRSRHISPSQIRQIASRNDRTNLPSKHPLRELAGIQSVPSYLTSKTKIDTVDTPENRFVKHVLQEFQRFCGLVCRHIESNEAAIEKRPYIYQEALTLEEQFGAYLNHNMFREISRPDSLPLNSPVLQRKEGYREILRVWLMFDLAAKLIWDGFDQDQYQAGKRDVATLYEYWLFFKMLKLVQDTFKLKAKNTKDLIKETSDGLGIQLKAGKHVAVEGDFTYKKRHLKIKFSYNRTFTNSNYPKGGSWTKQMRPDYTLSLWPADFSEKKAEEQELIVHIHFDAKYKVEGLKYLIDDTDTDLTKEKNEQKEGTYKRADLLKMHAYKDAIRRTAGAYILYPGTEEYSRKGFHEIIPGLGAFPVSPSNNGQGLNEIKSFIIEVLDHYSNRASQREELSYHTYEVNKDNIDSEEIHEAMPEQYHGVRVNSPQDTSVLIGYYNKKQYQWIKNKQLYNIRVDKNAGLTKYSSAELEADYLLLHGENGLITDDIWKITSKEAALMSKQELKDKNYPSKPSRDYYFVYEIEPVSNLDFSDQKWDIRNLKGYSPGHGSARPFAVTLQELLSVKVM